MTKARVLVLCVSVLTVPLVARAEMPADLADYVRRGLQANPELDAAREQIHAAEARVPQVTAAPEPQLRYAWFPRAIQTRTGPQRNRIGVTQAFPWFGVLSRRGDVAERNTAQVRARVSVLEVEITRRIKRYYYDYGYLAELKRVTEDSLALLMQLEPIAQRKVQVGASQEDLLRLQMEIGRIEDHLATIDGRRRTVSAKLSSEIGGLPGAELLPWPRLELPQPQLVAFEVAWGHARQSNREIARLRREVERHESSVELARLGNRPQFSVSLDYLETGGALAPNVDGGGEDPFSLSAMVTIPLRRSKYASAVSESKSLRAATELRIKALESRLATEVEQHLYELDDADRKLALYRDTLIPRARQTLTLTQRSYQTGTATLIDWLGTERELLEFDRSMFRAGADYLQHLADLEALCGGSLPWTERPE